MTHVLQHKKGGDNMYKVKLKTVGGCERLYQTKTYNKRGCQILVDILFAHPFTTTVTVVKPHASIYDSEVDDALEYNKNCRYISRTTENFNTIFDARTFVADYITKL